MVVSYRMRALCESVGFSLPCLGKLKEELTCSICLDVCVRPCTTPCGHNFCRRCLRGALQYSMKCPKCREALPHGFPLNINTVLWNTIQLLFPKVCGAPSSPSSQCAALNSGRDSSEQYGSQYEADTEVLQMDHESLAAEGHDSLDFLLSRLDISDPYAWEVVGRNGRMHYHPSPQFVAAQSPSASNTRHTDHHLHGPLYAPDAPLTNAMRPRPRMNHAQDVYPARSRRRQLAQFRHMAPSRDVEARQPLSSQTSPLNNQRVLPSHPERRVVAGARQARAQFIPPVVPPTGVQEAASVLQFSHYESSSPYAEWRNYGHVAVPLQPSHTGGDWRIRQLHVRDGVESPQESYDSPTSISPVSAEGTRRYFDEEDWLELGAESDRLEAFLDAQEVGNSWGVNQDDALESYLDLERREDLDVSVEDHDGIDLSEYRLIEGIDGPRIIPRRHRAANGRGAQRMSGLVRPLPVQDFVQQTQAEAHRMLRALPDNHESQTDWPVPSGRDRGNRMFLSPTGSGSDVPGSNPSWNTYRDLRRQLILAENSAESDGSSVDLDGTVAEGLFPYLSQASTSTRPPGYRGRYPGRGSQRSFDRQNPGQEDPFPGEGLEASDRAIARETFDQLYDISHQLSTAVSGINLAQTGAHHPHSSGAQFGEDALHSGPVHDLFSENVGVGRPYIDPVAGSHEDIRASFDMLRQSEDEGLYVDNFQFQRTVRHACQLSGSQGYDYHM